MAGSGSEVEGGDRTSIKQELHTDIVHKKFVTTYPSQDFKAYETQSTNNESKRLNEAKSSAERGREFRARKAMMRKQIKQQQDAECIQNGGPSVPESNETSIIEKRAKSAEATRRWREKKRSLNGASKKQAKTTAQRMREYRMRKNWLSTTVHLNESSDIQYSCFGCQAQFDNHVLLSKHATTCTHTHSHTKRPKLDSEYGKGESTKTSTEIHTITSRKKTNAQKCREYREKKKLQNTMVQNVTAERSDECNQNKQVKKPKTNAERRKKHYEAQKLKNQKIKKIPKTAKQRNKEYYERKKTIRALNALNHHSDAGHRKFSNPKDKRK